MSVNTEPYTNGAARARQATEQSVDTWKRGVKALTDRADLVTRLPKLDLTEPVTQYFEYLQQIFDVNRELATRWAELVTTLTGTVREQAEKVKSVVSEQIDSVADLAVTPARQAEELANEQTELAGSRQGGQAGRAGRRQAGPGAGPAALRGTSQGRAVRSADRAGTAQDRHRRGAHRAPRHRRQRIGLLRIVRIRFI